LCLSCSSRRIARELGVHGRTSDRWCWWLRNAAVSYETDRQVEGTVEADDLYHTAGNKGQAQHGGKKALGRRPRGRRKKREPGRGITTKTAQRFLPGSVAREQSSSRRPKISRCRRCKKPPTSPSKRGVGSTRTRPAAIGH
jgi:hypothetical protein